MVRAVLIVAAAAFVVALASSPLASAGKKSKSPFTPGPLAISSEEAAIVADPDAGVEHGVILVRRTARNEQYVGAEVESRHVRAKILSNEGRDLANVEVPLPDGARLQEWWGRTLLPDGTVLELHRSDLEKTTIVEGRGTKYEALKAALPGVVPGCVVDFGWSVKNPWITSYWRVPIQTDWPIRSFSYRWKPPMNARAASRLYRVDGLDVTAVLRDREIVVTARDLPPVVDEPLMPADQLVRASVVLYHLPSGAGLDDFWNSASRELASWIRSLIGSKKQRRRIVEAMELPADGTLERKMRAAYDWVGRNLTRTDVRTFEEIEAGATGGGRSKSLLVDAMRDREGSPFALQLVLLAVAEELGAAGHIVVAADRTDWLFDRHLRSLRQIDASFAAVDVAGDGSVFLLDPGSGVQFGDIPWRYSGSLAFMPMKDGAGFLELPFLGAFNSGSRHDVDLEILDDDDLLAATWTATRFGQAALETRIDVRRLAPEDRQERLDTLCGAASDRDVLEAQPEGLDDLDGDFVLRCEAELPLTLRGGRDRSELAWRGPWLREPPDLPDAPRLHPIEFNFPRSDTLVIRVAPPQGLAAVAPPPVEQFETDHGGYSLEIVRDGDGYTIARHLYISSTTVDPGEYVALREFFERVRRADRTLVEFRRSAAP